MALKHRSDKAILGWSETVDFPNWNIVGLTAKVDTGARTSALHVEDLEVLPNGRVRFHVILDVHHEIRRVLVEEALVRRSRVRSSTGHYTKRCFIKTPVQIGAVRKEIEISLVSRELMVFRMLLGRQALAKDFLVDVSRRHVATPSPSRHTRNRK